jgi:AmiR/NasT family two-component response regulator
MIAQAQGILMEREHITADQAFDILRRASQRLNVKLRDVAQGLVDAGGDSESASTVPEDT